MDMKESLGLKIAAGLSSTAITGALLLVLEQGTTSLPSHWAIDAKPVEVQLVIERNGGQLCDWLSADPNERIARCPSLVVTAKRLHASLPGPLALSPAGNVASAAQPAAQAQSEAKQTE
jgi:hypothetical protein